MLGQFERVLRALADAEVDYLIVGGVAVVMHGYLRTTKDIDLAVALDEGNLVRCIECLTDLGYRPHAPVRALDFADATTRESWVREKNMTVFSLWHPDQLAPTVDIFGAVPFDYPQVRSRAVEVMLGSVAVSVVSRTDLVAMKEAVGRPQDQADVLELKKLDEQG